MIEEMSLAMCHGFRSNDVGLSNAQHYKGITMKNFIFFALLFSICSVPMAQAGFVMEDLPRPVQTQTTKTGVAFKHPSASILNTQDGGGPSLIKSFVWGSRIMEWLSGK